MHHRFWLYLTGRAISALGSGMGAVAMVWLVYELTGSKLAMGGLYVTGLTVQTLVRLAGAPLLDRFNRLRLMALLDGLLFVANLAPLALSATGHLAIWHLYALQALAGAALALHAPASLATLPALAPRAELIRATSLLSGFMMAAQVSGPFVAGLLIRWTSSEFTLALDGLTFAVSALVLLSLPVALGQPHAQAGAREGYLAQMAEGFRFFRQVPSLLVLTLMYGVSYLSAYAIFTMHIPYAQEHLGAGAEVAGFLQGFWPLGFLLGSLTLGYMGKVQRRLPLLLSGLVTTGVALAGLGLTPAGWVPLALACKALEGFGFALFSNTFSALFQSVVPDAVRGRASAVQLLMSWGGNPLGAFLGAVLAESMGIGPAFVLMGALPILTGLAGFALPLLRSVDGDLTPLKEAVS
ncbi:MAG: MFS transporter [Bacillota bacterium]